MISASQTGGLDIMNSGSVDHNLAVQGTDAEDRDDPAGWQCPPRPVWSRSRRLHRVLRGRRPSGVGHAGDAAPRAGDGGRLPPPAETHPAASAMTPEQMDQAMKDSIAAFPASDRRAWVHSCSPRRSSPTAPSSSTSRPRSTNGRSRPGKTVEARTYNGTVPGPTIKVDPGDHVKIVLHNELPESTSIHFHGLTTPNSMDGATVRHPGPGEARRDVHLRVDGAGHARRRHVPLTPQRGGAGAGRPRRRVHRRRRAGASGRRR